MSKTIWKVALTITGKQIITVPAYGKILSVQLQAGVVCLWVEVDPTLPRVKRTIRIFGTGHPMNEEERQFIGTVQQGQFVWHVFEETPVTREE